MFTDTNTGGNMDELRSTQVSPPSKPNTLCIQKLSLALFISLCYLAVGRSNILKSHVFYFIYLALGRLCRLSAQLFITYKSR